MPVGMVQYGHVLFFGVLLGFGVQAQTSPAVPTVLPTNWTSIGCYTDISTSRTLAASSEVVDPMTVETCIAFCAARNYIYAGVEFGHCDSTIQIPSQPAPMTDCDMPCSGNANETCGGSVRLNIFGSNSSPPVLVKTVTPTSGSGLWTYDGCFTDSVSARTLGSGVNIPSGTTAESCTAACQAAGGFIYAGLENGHECWCDNVINLPAQHVGDADCRELCSATHSEYCGNANRVAVYHFSANGAPPPQTCSETSIANFTLRAQFLNPPTSGPASVPLKIVAVEMVQNVLWTILTACPLCCSEWPNLSLSNSIMNPISLPIPSQQMASTLTNEGESPNFVASIPAFPGSQSYCTMPDVSNTAGPSLLAFNGETDSFSLCTNTSANARLDVVFAPVTGHPHYNLDICQPIKIQVITS